MFGSSLDDYLHLLVPPVVKLFDSSDIPLTVRRLVDREFYEFELDLYSAFSMYIFKCALQGIEGIEYQYVQAPLAATISPLAISPST